LPQSKRGTYFQKQQSRDILDTRVHRKKGGVCATEMKVIHSFVLKDPPVGWKETSFEDEIVMSLATGIISENNYVQMMK
jgi:hypothetical protein